MAKAKLVIDGAEKEVDLPEGYLAPDEVKANYMPKSGFEAELARRSESITNKKLADLEGDDEFFNKLIEKRGVKIADPTKENKLTTDQLKDAQAQWEKKHLEPLKKQLEEKDQRITKFQSSSLNAEIMQAAAAAGINPALLKSPVAGQPAPFVAMIRELFGYDDKTGGWYVRKGDSFEFSSTPSEDNGPYKRVSEFVKEWAGDKENKAFIVDRRQGGAELGAGGKDTPIVTATGGRHVISRADAADLGKYKAAKAAAEKAGVSLVIAEQ